MDGSRVVEIKVGHIRLGKTLNLLPPLVKELDTIDVFLHDSEHTRENMTFEFEETWPKIPSGGLLLSDDVNLAVTGGAFYEFAARAGRRPARIYAGYGAIRK